MSGRSTVLACALFLASAAGQAQDPAAADAARMQAKLQAIAARGNAASTSPSARPLTTSFTDREVNAYFKVNGAEVLPAGLEKPELTIEDGGRVRSKAIVDLDVALQSQKRSMFDPLAWIRGKTEITATGVVRGAEGKGTIAVESATLGGVPVPVSLLQQVVNYYTRTPDNPKGIDLTQPFDLPANIQSIRTAPGQATVVQR